MNYLPVALQSLIEALSALPGVGNRSAERYAYYLLKATSDKSNKLADSLQKLHREVKYCPVTFALIDINDKVSPLYSDIKRDKTIVAVVEDPFDVIALERTGAYSGTYHVLGGLISPIDGIGPDDVHISELLNRIKTDSVNEVILATNASVEGESTALHINKQLEHTKIKVTRLAQGLPIGLDLEYADQVTLSRALVGRRSVS